MTADQTDMIIREMDKLGTQLLARIDRVDATLTTHNGRLRKVEEAHAFLAGAKDAIGWRLPLISSVLSGVVVGTTMLGLKLLIG